MADMVIKHIPEDFIVQEVLVADYSPEPEGREALLFQLDKKGYSGMICLNVFSGVTLAIPGVI